MLNILRRQTKTNYCNIVKYSSLLCFKAFLSSLSYHFDSAGIVTLLKGENRSQRKSESLVEYLGRFRHTGGKLSLCNFGVVVGDSYFPGADGYCRHTVFFTTASLFFPFPCEVLKFEGSLGKFVWGLEFTYLCKKLMFTVNVWGW